MIKIWDPELALKVLREARQHVEGGPHAICVALMAVAHQGDDNATANMAYSVKAYVLWELGPHLNLFWWLNAQLPDLEIKAGRPAGLITMARLAWIDRMIYELETKGVLP